VEEITYIHDEDKLAELFDNLKRGRCDECNEFCEMLIPPYKVKITKKSHTTEGGLVLTRESKTGFISNCADHTPNGVNAWVPSGEEGVDWKLEDEIYFVREMVLSHHDKQLVIKEYKDNGRTYRYPSHTLTPVFVWMWVKLQDD
jgi:hypothetical protein